MDVILNDSFLITDGNGIRWQTGPGAGGLWQVSIGAIVQVLNFTFNDSFSLNELFINQPIQQLNDALLFNDGFNLQLGSLLLLFDSDFFIIDDFVIQETVTSLQFSDQFLFNDSFFTGAGNNPSIGDSFSLSDNTILQSGCFIILGDNVSFNDALFLSEGFVGESELLNDSLFIQDQLIIHIPNVGLLLLLGDSFTFSDSMNTSNIEMLNTYLRRYLNDVIPHGQQ